MKVRRYIDIEERASTKMKRQLGAGRVKPMDVQRLLRAAAGDIAKADRLLDAMARYNLTGDQKKRMAEYGEAHPRSSPEAILQEARRPRVERKIVVRLSDRARTGLESASEKLSMSPDEVASQAVEEWLSSKGFV